MKRGMKILIVMAAVSLLCARPLRADTIWTSGNYEIVDGDLYGEIWIHNDVTVDIFGGEIYRLAAYDTTVTDAFGGQMTSLWTLGDSIVSIYSLDFDVLYSAENSSVFLYAYEVVHHPTGGIYDTGWIEGRYFQDDTYFSIDLGGADTISHVTIVPEPTTLSVLVVGALLLKIEKGAKS